MTAGTAIALPGTPLEVTTARADDGTLVLSLANGAAGGRPRMEVRVSEAGAVEGSLEIDGNARAVPASEALGLLGAGGGLRAALAAVGTPLRAMERAEVVVSRALAGAGADAALARVHPGALASLSAVSSFSSSDLAFYSADGTRGERRRQAAAAAPLFALAIPADPILKIAVERAKPLAEALLASMRGSHSATMPNAALKRLCAVREPPAHGDLASVCWFAASVPHDWIPSGGPEWRAFCLAAHGIVSLLGAPAANVPALVKGCGGKWEAFRDRMAKEAGAEAGAATDGLVLGALRDARDMLAAFADVVAAPLAAHSTGERDAAMTPETRSLARDAAAAMLLTDRSAPSVLQLSRRWHHHRGAILEGTRLVREERRRQVQEEVGPDGWPPLTAPARAPNGLWVVPLANSELIRREGLKEADPDGVMGLNHCVGGYSAKCQRGESHIASVREELEGGSFRRVSTVEFGPLRGNGNDLEVLQNRGWDNCDPGTEALDAVAWYCAEVRRGAIPVDRARMDAYHEAMRRDEDGVRRFCGYDWTDRDQLNAAVGPWGPFVSGAFRGHGLDDLLGCAEVSRVAASYAPSVPLLAVGRR